MTPVSMMVVGMFLGSWLDQHKRAKKTLFGLGMTAAGFSTMFASPFAGKAIGISDVANLGSFYLLYISGFVVLLFGVGYLLLACNLWGEAR